MWQKLYILIIGIRNGPPTLYSTCKSWLTGHCFRPTVHVRYSDINVGCLVEVKFTSTRSLFTMPIKSRTGETENTSSAIIMVGVET